MLARPKFLGLVCQRTGDAALGFREVPEDPHHAITERRGVPTAIWEIIFSCGYLETTERTPLAKFRHFTECPFCRADMGVVLLRTVWLALICLIFLGVLFILRSNIGARPIHGETASPLAPSDIGDRPPLAKSDRLPSPYFDKSVAKTAGTILPAVPEAASNPKQADDLVDQVKAIKQKRMLGNAPTS